MADSLIRLGYLYREQKRIAALNRRNRDNMAPSAIPVNGQSHEADQRNSEILTLNPIDGSSSANGLHTNGLSNGGPTAKAGHTNGHSQAVPDANGSSAGPTAPDPIAIVGMGCRLPGDVTSAEEFWELCSRARSGWSSIPKERFNHETFHHPNPDKLGTYNPKGAHFLSEDVGLFDAPFFNLTEKEAISLDPQQRLLLECTYEALENGGITKKSIDGQNVGVYVGGSFADYELRNCRDTDTAPMYQATGCAQSLLANRLSYYFGLTGPSFTCDTACSSSMTALHLAVQSLQSGESDQAIVGSCHLNILPDYFIIMSMQRYVK
jgi:hypothetical protein